ncbi:MAG: hypothetical protein NTU91_15680, partial [Chloroflexi bacterium]|nr:hypothetical protein [Chloroflexota bacterium]
QLWNLPSLLGTFPLDQFLAIGRNASDQDGLSPFGRPNEVTHNQVYPVFVSAVIECHVDSMPYDDRAKAFRECPL